MILSNQCQLITYPDSLGGDLKNLHRILNNQFKGLFGSVHILPFYPSSADRGFSPTDYSQVNKTFGNWNDVQALAKDYKIMADIMVNHISTQSPEFQHFLRFENKSKYKDMFLNFRKFSTNGEIAPELLQKVYKRKPRLPFVKIKLKNGKEEKFWCTFSEDQIDLDINSEQTKEYFKQIITILKQNGISYIRLDAFAYTIKKLGTNCFFVEPEIWQFLDWLKTEAKNNKMSILPEIHEHFSLQQKLSQKGYQTYDFALPFLVIDAIYNQRSKYLTDWLNICPKNQFNTLDTHDGIGITDVIDLLPKTEIDATVEKIYQHGANLNYKYSTPEYHNLDLYQINSTYFSSLGNNITDYLLARIIQLFSPGIPQIYYEGLLFGKNHLELVEKSKNGRDINRYNYTYGEVCEIIKKPEVRKLFKLIKFRNTNPSFNGDYSILTTSANSFQIKWQYLNNHAILRVNLQKRSGIIEYTNNDKIKKIVF